MSKIFPLKKKVFITDDSMSFENRDFNTETELPINGHCGAFGAKRKNHTHEGVDLYCPDGTEVFAIEDGEVVLVEDFTGTKCNSPWWGDTRAVHIEGESGVIVYGEIIESDNIKVGAKIKQGDLIGSVATVLKKDKGRPMSMLHVELYEHGSRASVEWHPWEEEPPQFLKNPTELLLSCDGVREYTRKNDFNNQKLFVGDLIKDKYGMRFVITLDERENCFMGVTIIDYIYGERQSDIRYIRDVSIIYHELEKCGNIYTDAEYKKSLEEKDNG